MTKKPVKLGKPLVDQLRKELGLSEPPPLPRFRLATGIPPLDHILGGGIPLTAFTVFYGPESSSKTTVAAHIAAEFQKRENGIVVWVDNEYSFSNEYFQALGVNPELVLFKSGLTVEGVFALMEQLVELSQRKEYSGSKFLFVWDSIPTTPTDMEESANFDQQTPAASARALSVGFRKIATILSQFPPIAFLVINQVRENFNASGWGQSYDMYGGWALRHYSSLIVQFSKKRVDRVNQSIHVKAYVEKSKVEGATLFSEAHLVVRYGVGVDIPATLLEYAKKVGVVSINGGWYRYEDKNYRREELLEQFRKEPERVWQQILEKEQ